MDSTSTIALMRRDTATVLRQVERAQANAAALVQWYANLGGDAWATAVPDDVWTTAGITKLQFKRAMADLAVFPVIMNQTVVANIADAAYKIQLIG